MKAKWKELKQEYVDTLNSIILEYAKILEELKAVSTEEEFEAWCKEYLED